MTVYSLFGAVEYGALSAIYGSNLYLSTPELNQNAVRLIWNSISCQVELVLPQFLPIAYRGFLIPSPLRRRWYFFILLHSAATDFYSRTVIYFVFNFLDAISRFFMHHLQHQVSNSVQLRF